MATPKMTQDQARAALEKIASDPKETPAIRAKARAALAEDAAAALDESQRRVLARAFGDSRVPAGEDAFAKLQREACSEAGRAGR